jgi:acetyl esterase
MFICLHNTLLKKKCPGILYLHGGGMVYEDRGMLPEMEAEAVLEQGYMVVSSDYRLIPGSKYSEVAQDALDAYEWMLTAWNIPYGIDNSKIAIVGSSAGARLALLCSYMAK